VNEPRSLTGVLIAYERKQKPEEEHEKYEKE